VTYLEKLKDIRWQKKRFEILVRDQWTCTLCEDKETTLHIHHLKYNGNPWEVENEFLITLCEHCHTIVSYYKLHFRAEVLQIKKRIFKPHQIAFEVYDAHNGVFYSSLCFLFNKNIVYIHKEREDLEWVLPLIHLKVEFFTDIVRNAYATENNNTELLDEVLSDICKDLDFVDDSMWETEEQYYLWRYLYIAKGASVFLNKLGYE